MLRFNACFMTNAWSLCNIRRYLLVTQLRMRENKEKPLNGRMKLSKKKDVSR